MSTRQSQIDFGNRRSAESREVYHHQPGLIREVKREVLPEELLEDFATFAHKKILEEREACAQIADRWKLFHEELGELTHYQKGMLEAGKGIAAGIRARSTTPQPP